MPANKMDSVPDLTFVSITGPALDKVGAKAMRAHITRANFARRRRRLVRDYAEKKECASHPNPLQVKQDGLDTDRSLVVDIRLPMLSHPGLDRRLNRKDAFFIGYCT